ncbi:ubiquinone biosynthesis regulatory protein kinase UbiB [Motilimonas pumila]|uniref:Probable protein kinase UbiB n=1 Tax=Motilimonas pumila TaxID=2303987 RepID=A0A418YIJ6_9GAMM|nr:ubiquinone biosynthesis regulatory protein kinase UbiB [Motilimonas pumila]RJG50447.1 ubiquinone biosynthesis regulatory protein kinase UbiB [Motilimonas pumila]
MKFNELRRFYFIVKTFLNYGLDELIPKDRLPLLARLGRKSIFWIDNQHADKALPERFRLALQTLGPVYIKLGQMLSTRRDLLPPEYAEQLALLQDQVEPFCGELAQQQIEHHLGAKVEQLFDNFEATPLASASIAQVHTANLKSCGREVVIKVIRPGIDKVIKADVQLMKLLASLVQKYLPEADRLRPLEVVQEYEKTIVDELDLMREGANAIQLRRNFEGSKELYVPEIISDYCTHGVLVMERIYGIPVSDIAALEAQGTNMKLLAERGVETFFAQVFRDSFFHADMHPGNVFVSYEHPEDPLWIGIDCGIVGTLNKEDQRYLAENFLAFFNRDYRKVAQLHVDSGWVPPETKVEEFEFAIRAVCEPIFEKPLAEISFGHVLLNLFNTARRFNMKVQPQLVLLQKTLLYIEGLGRQLYPQLDLWKTAKPFLENWMMQQVGPKAVVNAIKDKAPYWAEKIPEFPELIYDGLKQFKNQQHQMYKMQSWYQEHSRNMAKSRFWALAGTGLVVAAAALYDQQAWLAYALGGGGFFAWLLAYQHSCKKVAVE